MAFDWSRYAVGGAQRPDSFSGMDPQFSTALANMFSAAPPEILQHLRVTSGYRSPQRQAELWDGALKKYGSPEAARKWVAPPGKSNHNHGHASDLKYLDPSAMKWAHENADRFGLAFPLSNENWHIELAGRRGGVGSQVASQQASPPQASSTPAPTMGEPINIASQSQGGIMGAFAPVPQQQQQPSFMAGVDQIKNGNYLEGAGQMFGSMSAGSGQQAPQTPAPMQLAPVQGPSAQQATALSNYVQSLLGKKVANG